MIFFKKLPQKYNLDSSPSLASNDNDEHHHLTQQWHIRCFRTCLPFPSNLFFQDSLWRPYESTQSFCAVPPALKSKNYPSPLAHAVHSLQCSVFTIEIKVTSVLPSDSPRSPHPLILVSKVLWKQVKGLQSPTCLPHLLWFLRGPRCARSSPCL